MRCRARRMRRPLALLAAGAASASAATYTVTTTADTAVNDADCQPASCSLRQAMTKAVDGDTVIVPASTTPYLVSNGQLTVLLPLTIKGAGAGSSVIQATAGNHDRVMLINGNSAAVRLEDLTITGGDTDADGEVGRRWDCRGRPGTGRARTVSTSSVTRWTRRTPARASTRAAAASSASTSLTLTGSTVSDNTVNVPASRWRRRRWRHPDGADRRQQRQPDAHRLER